MNKHLEITLNWFNLPKKQIDLDKVLNVYLYGSKVYQCDTENSDTDYIIIYEQDIDISDTIISESNNLNATLISPKYFQKMLDEQHITAIECFFLRNGWKYETQKFNFNLDLIKLRKSISSTSSNSWVKCKKKFKDNEEWIGKKSLFHSLRILDFGIQLSKNNMINFTEPYSQALVSNLKCDTYINLLLDIDTYDSWEELKYNFQPIYNALKTEFRIINPLK